MKRCSAADGVTEEELIAYLDGEGDEAIKAHLGQCPRCTDRVGKYARLQNDLLTALFRGKCPPPEVIGGFHLGMLSRKAQARVVAHLAACAHCAGELEELKAFLEEEEGEEKEPATSLAPLIKEIDEKLKASAERGMEIGKEALERVKRYAMRYDPLDKGGVAVRFLEEMVPVPSLHYEPPVEVEEKVPFRERPAQEVIFRLTLSAEVDARFTAYRQKDPALCTIEAGVEIPARWPKLAGTEVIMVRGNRSYRSVTDEEGLVRFQDVPVAELPHISLQVIPPEVDDEVGIT
jgi:predicted anti-sigma-YlaC factor YlaD